MENLKKVAHVLKGRQTRNHECHWPGCPEQVPPSMWGCKKHWFMLPSTFRKMIWATYVPGQEITKTPSKEYLAVATKIQDWIRGLK